jgi:hypothetical protein
MARRGYVSASARVFTTSHSRVSVRCSETVAQRQSRISLWPPRRLHGRTPVPEVLDFRSRNLSRFTATRRPAWGRRSYSSSSPLRCEAANGCSAEIRHQHQMPYNGRLKDMAIFKLEAICWSRAGLLVNEISAKAYRMVLPARPC